MLCSSVEISKLDKMSYSLLLNNWRDGLKLLHSVNRRDEIFSKKTREWEGRISIFLQFKGSPLFCFGKLITQRTQQYVNLLRNIISKLGPVSRGESELFWKRKYFLAKQNSVVPEPQSDLGGKISRINDKFFFQYFRIKWT